MTRTVSRIIMVAVFLLLPVFLTGASLEVPGVDCCPHNCSMVAQCAGHAGADHLPEGWTGHHHDRHAHDRILLLRDAGLRYGRTVALVPPQVLWCPLGPVVVLGTTRPRPEPIAMGSPLYGGFLLPLRC